MNMHSQQQQQQQQQQHTCMINRYSGVLS